MGKLSRFQKRIEQLLRQSDVDYLLSEVPRAFDQCLDGRQRVTKILQAMKEFSHPRGDEALPVDLNRSIETTVAISRNEWKYVAEVERHLDDTLPMVPCLQGEFNQPCSI